MVTFFALSVTLFLIMDSVGSITAYLNLVNGINSSRQRFIVFREMLIALGLIVCFAFFGQGLLDLLDIQTATVRIANGVLLFLIALRMIFPSPKSSELEPEVRSEPFIVPIAMPMIAGPSILATVMLYAYDEPTIWPLLAAILIAWAGSVCVLLLAPKLKEWLGDPTLMATERLMGLILTLLSVEMLLNGIRAFVKSIMLVP